MLSEVCFKCFAFAAALESYDGLVFDLAYALFGQVVFHTNVLE